MRVKRTERTGITFIDLLQIAFIVLKLCGVISWSWWWVLAPTLATILIAVIVFLFALIKEALD